MSTGEFDPRKALGEEITGLNNVLTALMAETRQAEMKAAEAAQHYDTMVKLKAFAEGELARKRQVMQQLLSQEDKR